MSESSVQYALHELAQAAFDIAKICDQDIKVFSSSWHRIANNARVLESSDTLDTEDVKSLMVSLRGLFSYHPGSFTEYYIPRSNPEEQVRENEQLDVLRDRVEAAAAEVRELMKIDPRSY